MHIYTLRFLQVLFFLFLGALCEIHAQAIITGSETIKRMYADAEARNIHIDNAGVINLGGVCSGKEFHICKEGNIIRNIGITLFPSEMDKSFATPVYEFIERYFLALLLKKNKREQEYLLKEDFVMLSVNGKEYIKTDYSLSSLLQAINPATPFTLNSEEHHFNAVWLIHDGKDELKLSFPKQYDLILGMDKKELVLSLLKDLEQFNYTLPYEEFNPYFFQVDTIRNIYVETGGNYILPSVVSGKFLHRRGINYTYIYNERMGEESLRNLFSNADEMKQKNRIKLTVKGYKLSDTFDYTIDNLCAYMKAHACTAYIGMEEISEKEYKGTVFYINRDLMYKHLLHFHFPVEAFKKQDVPIVATLYPYIPINNIGTLYDDSSQ